MLRMMMALLVAAMSAVPLRAETVVGEYLEARNADVWTGPCFANGEMNIIGNKATMAWHVTKGSFGGVNLDGLSAVAVVYGDKTFGLFDAAKTRAVILVDQKATSSQRDALVGLVKDLAPETIQEIVAVESTPITMRTAVCDGKGCAELSAGTVKIRTRCLHERDSICGHEQLFYPVLAEVDNPYAAYAIEHEYTGKHLGGTFAHGNARSAVIATFTSDGSAKVAVR